MLGSKGYVARECEVVVPGTTSHDWNLMQDQLTEHVLEKEDILTYKRRDFHLLHITRNMTSTLHVLCLE